MFLSFLGVDVGKMSFYKVPFGSGNKYQTMSVAPGATVVVYTFSNWGDDFRAFIDKIGFGPSTLPWDRLKFIFEIDKEVVEEFNYQLAPVTRPKQFREPYIARREILWKVVNDDTETLEVEVLCDGMLVMKPKRT